MTGGGFTGGNRVNSQVSIQTDAGADIACAVNVKSGDGIGTVVCPVSQGRSRRDVDITLGDILCGHNAQADLGACGNRRRPVESDRVIDLDIAGQPDAESRCVVVRDRIVGGSSRIIAWHVAILGQLHAQRRQDNVVYLETQSRGADAYVAGLIDGQCSQLVIAVGKTSEVKTVAASRANHSGGVAEGCCSIGCKQGQVDFTRVLGAVVVAVVENHNSAARLSGT